MDTQGRGGKSEGAQPTTNPKAESHELEPEHLEVGFRHGDSKFSHRLHHLLKCQGPVVVGVK